MKKSILRVATLVMLFVLALSLVACSVPHDYKDARRNLRDEGYTVEVGDKDDVVVSSNSAILSLMVMLLDADEDTAKEVEEIANDIEKDLADMETDLKKALTASDEDGENLLIACYFEDSKTAFEYYGLIKDVFEIIKREGIKNSNKIRRSDITFGVTGCVVYFGTKDAVKASR